LRLALPITAALAAGALGLAAGQAIGFTAHRHRPALGPSAAAVAAELHGLPQHALSLGSASAPVTVDEYADLICGPCAAASRRVLAPAIASFVRADAARFVFEPIVESPRSQRYALGAYSAGTQRKGWSDVLLAYAESRGNGRGPAYGARALARAVGVRSRRWRSLVRRKAWERMIEQSARVALLGGFTSYPVFIVKGPGIKRSTQPDHRSVIILTAPTLAQLTQAIVTAEPPA